MINPNDDTIKAILATADKFVERELKDGLYERDRYPYSEYARAAVRGAGDAGLLLLTAPEDLAGIGLPPEAWALVLEKVGYEDAGFAASLLAHAMAAQAVLRHGPDALKSRLFGSDPAPLLAYPLYLQCDDPQGIPSAEKSGDGFVLSGAARLLANGPVADAAVIAAEMGEGGLGLFLVPLDQDSRPAPVEMLGLRSCPVGHLDLADLAVPADHLLTADPDALADLHALFYPAAAAILITTLKSSLDYALEYGRERWQGGQAIHQHSQLRAMYARMAAEHATLRQAILAVIANGSTATDRVALKIMAAELAVRATTDGVQLLGGYGYTMEYPQERKMRDARQAAELLGSPSRLRLSLIDDLENV